MKKHTLKTLAALVTALALAGTGTAFARPGHHGGGRMAPPPHHHRHHHHGGGGDDLALAACLGAFTVVSLAAICSSADDSPPRPTVGAEATSGQPGVTQTTTTSAW